MTDRDSKRLAQRLCWRALPGPLAHDRDMSMPASSAHAEFSPAPHTHSDRVLFGPVRKSL